MLICDFDGTLIAEDLEKDFLNYYFNKHLRVLDIFMGIIFTPINLLRKTFDRGSLVKVWTLFRTENEQKKLFNEFLEFYKPTINSDVISILDSYSGTKLLLSGCYELLLYEFLCAHKITDKFNIIIGAKTVSFGFFISQHPYGHSKNEFFDFADVGIGNEFADRYFLSKCRNVYLKNPDEKLTRMANKFGWIII
ncbi:hypothetical protein H3C22_13555 [Vibrio cholerae]|uniref:hypothetical protein n=1 Tax=Vibrio cholerae TaxID=666 RepID=UPI002FE6732D